MEVEGGTDGQHRHVDVILELVGPDLLPRTSEADTQHRRPAGVDVVDQFLLLDEVERSKLRRSSPDDVEAREPLHETIGQLGQQFRCATEQVDAEIVAGSQLTGLQHQIRAVDPIVEACIVEEVEGPPDRLAVGNDEFEVVEPVAVLRVGRTLHQSVHRRCRDGKRLTVLGRVEDPGQGPVVVDHIDVDAEQVSFPPIDHERGSASHRSALAS